MEGLGLMKNENGNTPMPLWAIVPYFEFSIISLQSEQRFYTIS